MDSLSAFARGLAAQGQPQKVFDWDEAARLIRERKPRKAVAGLSQDMEWTGGDIFRDGSPVKHEETYVYLSSSWAIPVLELDGQEIPCWRYAKDTPSWDSGTYWPDSALAILRGDEAQGSTD